MTVRSHQHRLVPVAHRCHGRACGVPVRTACVDGRACADRRPGWSCRSGMSLPVSASTTQLAHRGAAGLWATCWADVTDTDPAAALARGASVDAAEER
jgi:hypothetical protein